MDRRTLLSTVAAMAAAAVAALLSFPALAYLLSPLRRGARKDEWVDLGPADSMPDGVPALVAYELPIADGWSKRALPASAWVTRRGSDFQILTSVCPHLGCAVRFDRARGEFACPCHASAFAPDGRRLSGPSPRDLDPLEFRVERGRLLARHAEYRAGAADRVPA